MRRHLKNNTPVFTGVLWGGGLWWGINTLIFNTSSKIYN